MRWAVRRLSLRVKMLVFTTILSDKRQNFDNQI